MSLTKDEQDVLEAVAALNAAGRTTNTSQVASRAVLPRTRTQQVLDDLRASGRVRDVSKGTAYHWRVVK